MEKYKNLISRDGMLQCKEMHLRIRRLYAYANVAHLVAHLSSSRLRGETFRVCREIHRVPRRATVPRVMHISKFNAFWRRWYNSEHGTSITATVSQFAICDFWIAARMLRDDMLVKMIERRRNDIRTDNTSIFKNPFESHANLYPRNLTYIKSRNTKKHCERKKFIKHFFE